MENKEKKCSFKRHKEMNAISYCQECKLYMCNKCINHHQELFENHCIYNVNQDNQEIFIEICREKNHPNKLEFYCKNHNKLCCAACLTKIEVKGYGQHNNCNICTIEDIKEEKKNKLKENLKYLKDLSNNLDKSIKELKLIFETINESKEEIKLKIQKVFTNIRNAINEREDELLLEVDNQFNNSYDENIVKDCEKLPNKIKISLEKGIVLDKEWDNNNKLPSIINACISIENNIENVNLINENIKKCKEENLIKIEFIQEVGSIDNLIGNIKTFGKISIFDSLILKNKDDLFKFYDLISSQIKIKKIKRIYSSTKDGLNYESIVNKANNKYNLIFLYLTGNKRIFGVFIKTKLENIMTGKYYKDEKAFVFSLDNNKIYKIIQPKYALYFSTTFNLILIGNTHSSNGFFFEDKGINDKGLLNREKIYDFQKNNELTEGFNELTELEIFEISE